MAQTLHLKARGLVKTQNSLGEAPDGAMKIADEIVISRDGIAETRRGLAVWSVVTGATMVKKLFAYGGRLLAWFNDGSNDKLAFSDAGVSTWTNYSGTYPQPSGGTPMRVGEGNGNLYLTHSDGVKRLDSVTGSPVAAGSPQGLDIEASLVSGVVGTALKGDARFAYRVAWGIKDANSNLILGPPSGRFLVTSPAVDVTAGSLSRTGTTVTAQVAGHGFKSGDKIVISPGETNFPSGQKTVTGITGTTFTYTEAGTATASTVTHRVKLDTVDSTLKITIPAGITSSHFAQIYRSPGSDSAEVDPTDNLGLVFERSAPGVATVSTFQRTTNVVTVTTTANHGFDTGAHVNISGSSANFPGGVKLITVTGNTTFTYPETAADAGPEAGGGRTATPLTVVVTDSLPDTLLGAALYTNPQEEGILQSNTAPPAAREIAHFKGCLVYANCDALARLFVTLLAVGSPSGVQSGDTFTLDGQTYTAGATEDYNTRTFQVFTDSTPSFNVARTAASICRVINRAPANTTTSAYVIAGPDDEPGKMVFERRTFGTNVSFNPVSRKDAWNPPRSTTENAQTQKNAVYWSKRNQPDAVPLLQFQRLGSNDKKVLRLTPTRDSLFIWKEDGIWKMTGDGPDTFRFDIVDTTLELVAPETAVALDGTAFGLTEQGVVRVTDNGVLVVSRGVEVDFARNTAGDLRAITASIGFAVAYESDRHYVLYLPSTTGSTTCEVGFVYNLFTEAWKNRRDAHRCGLVNPVDEKLYVAESNLVWQERKMLDETDYSDRSFSTTVNGVSGLTITLDSTSGIVEGDGLLQGANFAVITSVVSGTVVTVDRNTGFITGAATRLTGIALDIEWTPKFGENPGALHHFQEVEVLFEEVYFAKAKLQFESNVSSGYESVDLVGTDLGFTPGTNKKKFNLRALVPREKRRASQLVVRLTHRQARSKCVIQGTTIAMQPGESTRAGK